MRKLAVLLVVALFALPLFATEPNPSPRQRELIAELMKITNANQAGVAVMDAMFAQMQKQYLGEAEEGESDDTIEARESFERFRELALKIDFNGTINEGMTRVYAKYFTEAELTDLITFYRTPTGQKAINVMANVMREAMEIGAKELTPKIMQIAEQVREEQEKKHPWRKTMGDMRSIATAAEAYATDQDDATYPRGDFSALEKALVPTYIKKLPKTDVWGHDYAYVASPDGKNYRVVSAGADGIFEWDSRRIVPVEDDAEPKLSERLEDDLIFANGQFIQIPRVASKE